MTFCHSYGFSVALQKFLEYLEQGKCAKNTIKTCKESVVFLILSFLTLVLLLCFTSKARAIVGYIVMKYCVHLYQTKQIEYS